MGFPGEHAGGTATLAEGAGHAGGASTVGGGREAEAGTGHRAGRGGARCRSESATAGRSQDALSLSPDVARCGDPVHVCVDGDCRRQPCAGVWQRERELVQASLHDRLPYTVHCP